MIGKNNGVILACMLAAGCAMAPVKNAALEDARSTYRLAAADPRVQLRAPVELAQAERALVEAEQLMRNGDASLAEHRAYVAKQRARIALSTAEYRDAEARVATSSEMRNRVLLDARQREAEMANERARAAEQRAEELAKSSEAQSAQAANIAADIGAEMHRLQAELTDLQAQQTERGWVLTMRNDLLFDPGKSSLKAGGQRAIDKLAQFMRQQPEREIAIEGFTDSTGSGETNRVLSERRAQAVKEALVAQGIEAARIDARGYGPAFPIASNDTPTGRQLNRRVEIIFNPS